MMDRLHDGKCPGCFKTEGRERSLEITFVNAQNDRLQIIAKHFGMERNEKQRLDEVER